MAGAEHPLFSTSLEEGSPQRAVQALRDRKSARIRFLSGFIDRGGSLSLDDWAASTVHVGRGGRVNAIGPRLTRRGFFTGAIDFEHETATYRQGSGELRVARDDQVFYPEPDEEDPSTSEPLDEPSPFDLLAAAETLKAQGSCVGEVLGTPTAALYGITAPELRSNWRHLPGTVSGPVRCAVAVDQAGRLLLVQIASDKTNGSIAYGASLYVSAPAEIEAASGAPRPGNGAGEHHPGFLNDTAE